MPQRKGVSADGYIVLRPRNGEGSRRLPELEQCCEALMHWADPGFSYSGVAVTKNFRGSPHVDTHDVTHQYACSFGSWRGDGGELCIEDAHRPCELVHVVNTRNKMVKVDGRYTHWVRSFGEQDVDCGNTNRGHACDRVEDLLGDVVDDAAKKTVEGDRFSLIFYSTEEKDTTDRCCSLYSTWLPAGRC